MAENATDKEDALVSEECRIIPGVIGGILSDESFGLPTEGNDKLYIIYGFTTH